MEDSGVGQHADDIIPHQDETEQVVEEQLESASDVDVLEDIADADGAPTEGEFNALVASHNSVLEVLRDAKLIPTAEEDE